MDGGFGGAAEARPSFRGSAGAMFPTVFGGLALTLVTLGVYRFWYVTNVRRFLWGNTEVAGDDLEYTGRGVELFIGFLIALAVVVPLYGALVLASLYLGAIGAQIANALYSISFIVLAQYALFRARRYRLTRTVWRGVRFQQSGSGWAYAGRSLAWALFAFITLGLAYPWMRASLERYKMTNTWFGDQQGAFAATGWTLFKRGIVLWLLCLVVFGGAFALAIALAPGMKGSGGEMGPAVFGPAAAMLAIFATIAIVFPLYQAIEFRWWAEGCSVGPATARCDLGLFSFFKVYLGYFGALFAFVALIGAIGGIVFVVFGEALAPLIGPGTQFGTAHISVMIATFLVYVVVGLLTAAIWQLIVVRPMWRKSFESVAIAGLASLLAAQSSEPPANAFGEGVADALDFGGF